MFTMKGAAFSLLTLAVLGGKSSTSAFVPPCQTMTKISTGIKSFDIHNSPFVLQQKHVALKRQRHSVAPVQTMSLFGLGAPEIIIILVAAAFVLGPEKIAELGKEAGKAAGELREVPKEFQKGLEEGETEARSKKAKQMDDDPSK
mmetsp:Transcript_28388/g.41861  ORF Transcript_28388/g.41861 Transcript_28388/m.41861 type:complete len:145 (+) Transcript_28388:130-564(+)